MAHISADTLVDALRSEGLRITEARRAVCQIIADHHGEHLNAADVYEMARTEAGTALDRATAYRTLEVLESAGLIRHGHLGHGPTVYHLTDEDHHQHLVCSSCGRMVAITEEDFRGLLDRVTELTGFVADVDHFALSGRCADCASGAEESEAR